MDFTKIQDTKTVANAPSTKLRKGVNPLLMVLSLVKLSQEKSKSPEPTTPLNIDRVFNLIDEAMDEKFKD